MTIFIEGTVFPIGEKNINGWGIPESEVNNAINSLKSSVVRICSRDDPHGCDVTEDPRAEIGNVTDAWRVGNLVKAKVAITDSIASQKIADGTWKNTWSIYGKAPAVVDGWPTNFNARSLTLVQNPAWKDAIWDMAASEGAYKRLRTFSEFTITASKNKKEKTGMITLKEVEEIANKLSAAASKKAITDYIEIPKKTGLIASIVEIRDGLKIKADNEKLNTLSASDLEERLGELQSIKLIAGGPGSGIGNKIPIFDPMTKSFSPYQGGN
jgi:hypothetical protein